MTEQEIHEGLVRYFAALTLDSLEWSAADHADDLLASDFIKQIRAEAWSQGFDAGERDVFEHEAHKNGFDSPCVSNPYGEEAK